MNEFNTKEIVNKYDFKFSKRLGQNFLIDDSVLEDIVKGAEVNSKDFIIEIGPGVGSLTKKLLERSKKVCAIEIDNRLIPILEEEFRDFNNLDLINEDALKINFDEIIKEEESVKIVANLPYYVTTPIIIKFLKEVSNFKSLTLMIQKEVGDRINSNPGTKDYGALSILCQYFCNVSTIRKVPANCFIPRPKVDSIVIHMERLDNPRVEVEDEKMFFDIVRKSFSMRRKTLNNCLKSLPINNEELNKAFEQSEIDSKRRAETLTIEEFAILANNIIKMMKK